MAEARSRPKGCPRRADEHGSAQTAAPCESAMHASCCSSSEECECAATRSALSSARRAARVTARMPSTTPREACKWLSVEVTHEPLID
eukprot:6197226-Pleurochrysis_carterae.AAC.4